MRRIWVIFAVLALAACGSSGDKASTTTPTTTNDGAPAGLTPTTGIGDTANPQASSDNPACRLLTPADLKPVLGGTGGSQTAGVVPARFASGGTGTINNCAWTAGKETVAVALVSAREAADAQAEFAAKTGGAAGTSFVRRNNGYAVNGKQFVTITMPIDEASAINTLLSKAKSRLP